MSKQQTLMLKSVILSMLVLETMDELETNSIYKHNIKRTANLFVKELDKYIDKIVDESADKSIVSDAITKLSKQFDDILNEEL